MARPTHPIDEPDRPDHGLPGRPGHPDHELPDTPQPKARRATKDAAEPTSAVSALLPPSVAVGDPTFVVRVIGFGFDQTSVIVFAGNDEETTFVSDTEVTTIVNMDVWLGPDPAIPVLVRTADVETNSVDFAFTPPREVPLPEAHASIPVPTMDLITRM